MKRQLAFITPPAALTGIALVAAGCGGYSQAATGGGSYGSAAPAPRAKSASVAARSTRLGRILVDGGGRSLYLFEKDKGTASSCSGGCAGVWPPLTTAGNGAAHRGLPAGKLGAIKRPDGTTQVTYAGHPLYTYAGDGKPGDVKGQGLDQFGAEWYVLRPDGAKIDNG